MNRRDMKKLIYRELAFFLNNSKQDWKSVPDWFHNLKNAAFREGADYGSRAENLRLDEVMSELMMALLEKGKQQ